MDSNLTGVVRNSRFEELRDVSEKDDMIVLE